MSRSMDPCSMLINLSQPLIASTYLIYCSIRNLWLHVKVTPCPGSPFASRTCDKSVVPSLPVAPGNGDLRWPVHVSSGRVA
jgi:hypothetical protein